MRDKAFIDTNILVYSIDLGDEKKRERAVQFLSAANEVCIPVISVQTLGELFNVMTRKLNYTKETASIICSRFSNMFPVLPLFQDSSFHAMKISARTKFSYWDSLILATAIESGCSVVYSEDLSDGQIVEGVRIVNPFS